MVWMLMDMPNDQFLVPSYIIFELKMIKLLFFKIQNLVYSELKISPWIHPLPFRWWSRSVNPNSTCDAHQEKCDLSNLISFCMIQNQAQSVPDTMATHRNCDKWEIDYVRPLCGAESVGDDQRPWWWSLTLLTREQHMLKLASLICLLGSQLRADTRERKGVSAGAHHFS